MSYGIGSAEYNMLERLTVEVSQQTSDIAALHGAIGDLAQARDDHLQTHFLLHRVETQLATLTQLVQILFEGVRLSGAVTPELHAQFLAALQPAAAPPEAPLPEAAHGYRDAPTQSVDFAAAATGGPTIACVACGFVGAASEFYNASVGLVCGMCHQSRE